VGFLFVARCSLASVIFSRGEWVVPMTFLNVAKMTSGPCMEITP